MDSFQESAPSRDSEDSSLTFLFPSSTCGEELSSMLRSSHPYAHALRERAIRLGIQNAVSSLFEARLFVSRCLEKGIKFHDIRIRENLKHFDIKPDESATILWLGEGTPYYAVPTCGRIFRLVDCLYLSWESQMAPYFDPEQKNETLKRRGMLLKSPREALAVEDCLSLWPPR